MKREILCPACGAKPIRNFIGEYHKKVNGEALSDYVCNSCNLEIPRGASCTALSIWSDHIPYFAWESKAVKELT